MAELSITQALAGILAHDGARPLVTQIWADGQRAELSVRTFENNVAKAANLLQDDAEAGPTSSVIIGLPLHWQTSVWLTACALVGARVYPNASNLDTRGIEPVAAIVDAASAAESFTCPTYVASLHPLGLPGDSVPTGTIDLAREVRGFSDVFVPYVPSDATTPWLVFDDVELTQGDALDEAASLARSVGLEMGGRLLIPGSAVQTRYLALSAIALVMDASIVICADGNSDVDAVMNSERCTAILTG